MAQCRTSPRIAENPVGLSSALAFGDSSNETDLNTRFIEIRPCRQITRKNLTNAGRSNRIERRLLQSQTVKLTPINSKAKTHVVKGATAASATIMKTKQKEDKFEDEHGPESSGKTRARKKLSVEDDKNRASQDPDTDKTTAGREPAVKKKIVKKTPVIAKKRPLGVTKTLRSKKIIAKDSVKKIIKQVSNKRGRKPARKVTTDNKTEKDAEEKPLRIIPASEIKKEPLDDTPANNSRSSSPKISGVRRQRLTSDFEMMKSVLSDSPTSVLLGSRTSPYSMRSERSNSPYRPDSKNLRSLSQRKLKNNLLNEIVKNEQKKRRLVSDSKVGDVSLDGDESKKLKRGRSFSRDGSEISKCSDVTDTDSLCDTLSSDADGKLDEVKKSSKDLKTELDLDNEDTPLTAPADAEKVPSSTVECNPENAENRSSLSLIDKTTNKIQSLKRSTSLDSDNNNRMKLTNIQNSNIESEIDKTESQTLMVDRSTILNNMSKTFNTKEMTKNIRKARRGRKTTSTPIKKIEPLPCNKPLDETENSLTKEINELIENLEMSEAQEALEKSTTKADNEDLKMSCPDANIKSAPKFYSLSDPTNLKIPQIETVESAKTALIDQNQIKSLEKNVQVSETTVKKLDDSENIRLRIDDDDCEDKIEDSTKENVKTTFKPSTQDIDKLMDKLKHFEELDKKRQQELKAKSSESVMVTNDVVLIPKSGAEIKPLKDIQATMTAAKPLDKGSVLSCFQNNTAISIVKRDHARKSVDIDLPNSITLIKRNPGSRKESTGSNSGDTISIIEKSLGKDVTLTELRRSIDKSPISPLSVDQYATIQPNKPGTAPQSLATIVSNKPQADKNESVKNESPLKEIMGTTNGNESSKKFIAPRRYPAYTPKSESDAEIMNAPLLAVDKVLSPKGETMKLSIQNVKSPTPEIKSNQATLATSQKLVTSKRSTTYIPKIKSDDEKINSPSLEVNQVLSTKTELQKLSLQTVKSPSSEIKFVQPTLVDSNKTILAQSTPSLMRPILGTVQAEIVVISADLPKEIKSDKTISTPSIVTASLSNVKSAPKGESVPVGVINITSVTAQEQMEITSPTVKSTTILVNIPPCDPKTTVTSPRSDEKKLETDTKSPQKVSTSPKETAKLPSPSKTLPNVEATIVYAAKASPKEETTGTKPAFSANTLPKCEATSIDAVPSSSSVLMETPESQKRKENILRTLGLLTLKAADEAKIEKQKQKEMRELASKNSQSKGKASSGGESSGTLKTVIKLNRSLNQEKKNKNRSSLKMTFQKSKGRAGKPSPEDAGSGSEEYYTIHKEGGMAAVAGEIATGGHRKTPYSNRFNNHEGTGPEQPTKSPEPPPGKETSLILVIPEKASSFSIHPGRLCQDQCFYCGGKFGLFDTPCHIAQMKSSERQKKVLDNEEKLTIDSCLCDACYRHVDRRANCPSYRKRPNFISKPSTAPPGQPVSPTSSDTAREASDHGELAKAGGRPSVCHAAGCEETAEHSIRRKWLIKMRNSVSKVVKLGMDYPGLHTIPLCGAHYKPVSQLMVCGLCRRRLNKHHNIHYISQGYQELNPLLEAQGVPVRFAERPVVCKLCRYFCTLLFRPNQQYNKKHFLKLHRRRLLQTYNIELLEDPDAETAEESKDDKEDDTTSLKQKKKNRTGKSKQRKSTDSVKHNEDSSESLALLDKEKETNSTDKNTSEPMEEDIESLISTNKIAKAPGEANIPSDNSDADTLVDFEGTLVPSFDKQTELQYLLQKQNNPAQFMHKPIANLTQKQRAVLKAHNASPIQKPATHVKLHEKNAKRIQKLGQIITQKEHGKTLKKDEETPVEEDEKSNESSSVSILKNISLTDECTIESIPTKKTADISILKNKWQMSESFSQVKKNLSELSKNVTVEKPKKSSDSKYSNPVRRLETNPSISVRELFPGEEEMNLQCSVEFSNVKGATPEGWEKCHSTIQYDLETKRLWNELQKPYGNQSSFLRHLVLLEKYFRSGDLVLAHNANGHATNYNDSVQSRLRAYDNVPEPPKRPQPAVSLIEFRRQKPSTGKSLLKSNQSMEIIPKPTEMKPPLSAPKLTDPSGSGFSKASKGSFNSFPPTSMPAPAVFAKPRSGRLVQPPSSMSMTSVDMRPSGSKQRPPTLPPELISIHTPTTQGRKSIENVLKNIQQLVKGVSAPPEPMEIIPISSPAPPPPQAQPPPTPPPPPSKPEQPVKKHKQRTTTKPWRPTLMQITQENISRIAREPTQIAVDGRSLPSLVQVMSGGQRYHITLADYNKMCIMRREKLQQIQVVENSTKSKKPSTEVVTEIQTSSTLGNGGTLTQNMTMSHVDNRMDTQDTSSTSFVHSKSDISEASRVENNAANILKNVGLKNITIAAVTERTKPSATVTSNSLLSPATTSSLVITSTPIKMPQLGPSVSITSDALINPSISSGLTISATPLLSYGATIQPLVMPKIPKSLTVIPQTVPITSTIVNVPTSIMNSASILNVPSSMMSVPSIVSVPTSMMNVPSSIVNIPSSTIVSVPSFSTIPTTGAARP